MEINLHLSQWINSLSWTEAGTILGVILGLIALLGHGVKAIQRIVYFGRWLRGLFAKTPSRKTKGIEAPPIQSLSGNAKVSSNYLRVLSLEPMIISFGKEPKMNQNQQTAVEIRRPLSAKEEVTLQQVCGRNGLTLEHAFQALQEMDIHRGNIPRGTSDFDQIGHIIRYLLGRWEIGKWLFKVENLGYPFARPAAEALSQKSLSALEKL